ncbi:MAG: Ribonuclease BN, partial [uncultured Gemmatimonadetes bacterium]
GDVRDREGRSQRERRLHEVHSAGVWRRRVRDARGVALVLHRVRAGAAAAAHHHGGQHLRGRRDRAQHHHPPVRGDDRAGDGQAGVGHDRRGGREAGRRQGVLVGAEPGGGDLWRDGRLHAAAERPQPRVGGGARPQRRRRQELHLQAPPFHGDDPGHRLHHAGVAGAERIHLGGGRGDRQHAGRAGDHRADGAGPGALAGRGHAALRRHVQVPPGRNHRLEGRVGGGVLHGRALHHRQVPDRPVPGAQQPGRGLRRRGVAGHPPGVGLLLVHDPALRRGVHADVGPAQGRRDHAQEGRAPHRGRDAGRRGDERGGAARREERGRRRQAAREEGGARVRKRGAGAPHPQPPQAAAGGAAPRAGRGRRQEGRV